MQRIINIILLIGLLFCSVTSYAQVPQKIKISQGKCNGACGYTIGFYDINYTQDLEYNLADSTFRYRKKSNKKYHVLKYKPSNLFTDTTTYLQLDTLYQNFTAFQANPGKYYIYRIELIYSNNNNTSGLPLKVKTMEFWVSTDPEPNNSVIIDNLIAEYKKVYWSHKN